MHNVIQFLESMGANPALARMTAADYCAAVDALDVEPAQRRALAARDHVALNELLDGRRGRMMLSQFAPLEEPEPQEGEPGEQAPDESEEVLPAN